MGILSALYGQLCFQIGMKHSLKKKAAERITRRRQNPKKPNENNLPFVLPAPARLQRRFSDAFDYKSHTIVGGRPADLQAVNSPRRMSRLHFEVFLPR